METNIHTTFRSTRFSLRERRLMGQSVGPDKEAEKFFDEAETLAKNPDNDTEKRLNDLQTKMSDLLKRAPGDAVVSAKIQQLGDLIRKHAEDKKKLLDLNKDNEKELAELTKKRDDAVKADPADLNKANAAWAVDAVRAIDGIHYVEMAKLADPLVANRPTNVADLIQAHLTAIQKIRKLAENNPALKPGDPESAAGGGTFDAIRDNNVKILIGDDTKANLEKDGLRKVVENYRKFPDKTSLEATRLADFIRKQQKDTVDVLLGHIEAIANEAVVYPTRGQKIKAHLDTIKEIQQLARLAFGPLDTGSTAPTAKPGDVVNETAKKAFTKLVAAVTEKKNITDATVTAPLAEVNVEFKKLSDKTQKDAFVAELKKALVATGFDATLATPDEITLIARTPALAPKEESQANRLVNELTGLLDLFEKFAGREFPELRKFLTIPGAAINVDEKTNEVNLTATLDNLRKERDRTDDAIRILKRNPRVDRAKLRELQDRLQRIDDAIEAIEADDKLSPDEKVKARQILRQLRDINRDAEDLGFNVQFHFQPGLSPFASVHSPVRPFGVNPYAYGPRYGAYQRPPYAAPYSQPGSTYIAGDYSYGKTSGSNKGPA